MKLQGAVIALALAAQAVGIIITHPYGGRPDWTTTGPNILTWTIEIGDPQFVDLQLVQEGSPIFQTIPFLLTADGIMETDVPVMNLWALITPSCLTGSPSLPTGSGYSLRMIWETEDDSGVTTNYNTTQGTFGIVESPATMCVNITSSGASSTATSASTSSSSDHRIGAIAGGVAGGLVFCILLSAGLVLYNRHRRNVRKRMTLHFGQKKGLATQPLDIGKNFEMSA